MKSKNKTIQKQKYWNVGQVTPPHTPKNNGLIAKAKPRNVLSFRRSYQPTI
jgi:hypothetical protein